jgi:hypothetical protein
MDDHDEMTTVVLARACGRWNNYTAGEHTAV